MNKLVLAFAFLAATQLNLASETNPKSLYARCRPGVVLITTENALGFNLALGTAFAVADGTKLITNFHVIRGATIVKIKTADDHEYDIKYILGQDEAHDVAILECPVKLPQLALSEETPSVGEARVEVRRLWNRGTKTLARKRVLEFVQENPNDPAAVSFAGDVMFFSGEWDEAITLYEKAIDLAPTSSYRQCWLWIALADTHMRRYDEALNAFEKLGPKSDHPANLLWQIYMTEAAAGRFGSARSTSRILMTARYDEEIKDLLRKTGSYSEKELTAFGRRILNVQLKQQLQNNARSHIPE